MMDYTELAKLFFKNSYELRKNHNQKMIDESMRGATFVILYLMYRGCSVLPSEISNEMNISSARIAATLNSLESKGMITRQIDTSDRRKILVDITEQGKELAQKHEQMALNGVKSMLEALGEHDARELVRILGKLVDITPDIMNTE